MLKPDDDLSAVIAEAVRKLRENDPTEDAQSREAGRLAGAEYAGNATKRQLRRLTKEVEDSDGRNAGTGTPEEFVGVANNGANQGHASALYRTLDPNRDECYSTFWENVLGEDEADRIEDEDFAIGFIEGMLSVWEVKNA